MAKTFEFTTDRGAKIALSNDGRANRVRINGGDALWAQVEDREGNLVILTDRLDPIRKIVIRITVPVPAAHVVTVRQFVLEPARMTVDDHVLDLVERIATESDRVHSKL